MIFELLKLNIPVTDKEFDAIYPQRIRRLGRRHWTQIEVAKIAAEFLAYKPGIKVLDIGSGAGKFCLAGAAHTQGYFVGVEQRQSLYKLSNRLSKSYNLTNVKFIHSNILDIPFNEFQAFYFFNSFYENIDHSALIDKSVDLDTNMYFGYSYYVLLQLSLMPVGTRLATYWSTSLIIPDNYELKYSRMGGLLKMWEKVN